jgi:hypothetical protein
MGPAQQTRVLIVRHRKVGPKTRPTQARLYSPPDLSRVPTPRLEVYYYTTDWVPEMRFHCCAGALAITVAFVLLSRPP